MLASGRISFDGDWSTAASERGNWIRRLPLVASTKSLSLTSTGIRLTASKSTVVVVVVVLISGCDREFKAVEAAVCCFGDSSTSFVRTAVDKEVVGLFAGKLNERPGRPTSGFQSVPVSVDTLDGWVIILDNVEAVTGGVVAVVEHSTELSVG